MEEYSSKWGLLVAIVTRLLPSFSAHFASVPSILSEEPFCSGTKILILFSYCQVTILQVLMLGFIAEGEISWECFSEAEEADLEHPCVDVADASSPKSTATMKVAPSSAT
jgi:hypothetical protein